MGWIIPLLPAVFAAASTSIAGYELANQPSAPKPPSVPTAPAPLTAQQSNAVKANVGGQLPNLQALTGGSLSPETSSVLAQLAAGTAGDPQTSGLTQQVINQFFGLGAPGNTGLAPSGGLTPSTSLPSLSSATSSPGLIDRGLNDVFQGFGGA
jgi:hypothetical protein